MMLMNIFKFELGKYISSNKLIFLGLVFITYLASAYSVSPQDINSSFSTCAIVIFLLMIAVGVQYDNINYDMVEQALLVKCYYKYKYYLGRIIALIFFSFIFAIVSVIVPILIHCINSFTFFTRNFQLSDILSGMVLFTLSGLCGGIIGLFFNKYIFKRRYFAITLAFLVGITSIVKGGVISEVRILYILKWLLPPLYEVNVSYCLKEYFSINNTLIYFIWMIVYIIVLSNIYIKIMIKKGIK